MPECSLVGPCGGAGLDAIAVQKLGIPVATWPSHCD